MPIGGVRPPAFEMTIFFLFSTTYCLLLLCLDLLAGRRSKRLAIVLALPIGFDDLQPIRGQ